VWTSLTPIVLPRHPKRRGANTLDGQILSELSSRDLPSAKVEVLLWDTETNKLRHYVRVRRHPAPQPPTDAGFVVRLTFERPVPGPLALGYASHYGLG
jgi:CRISPR-associated protein Csb2